MNTTAKVIIALQTIAIAVLIANSFRLHEIAEANPRWFLDFKVNQLHNTQDALKACEQREFMRNMSAIKK